MSFSLECLLHGCKSHLYWNVCSSMEQGIWMSKSRHYPMLFLVICIFGSTMPSSSSSTTNTSSIILKWCFMEIRRSFMLFSSFCSLSSFSWMVCFYTYILVKTFFSPGSQRHKHFFIMSLSFFFVIISNTHAFIYVSIFFTSSLSSVSLSIKMLVLTFSTALMSFYL